ncbi:hypothetical protein, partial [Borreliella garinii]|uniref:hypothetical protein n=1 Tax=Borreliella garinii TaxID=29519 RepID=UPI001AEFC1CA
MAPYAVAHLKLSQYLKEICEVDFSSKDSRLKVYLTNTIDFKKQVDQKYLPLAFLKDITKETKEANKIKESKDFNELENFE